MDTSSPLIHVSTQTALLTLLTKKGLILERNFGDLGGKNIFSQYGINEPRASTIMNWNLICDMNVIIKTEITKLQDCNIVELFDYYNPPEQMAYHFLFSFLMAYFANIINIQTISTILHRMIAEKFNTTLILNLIELTIIKHFKITLIETIMHLNLLKWKWNCI